MQASSRLPRAEEIERESYWCRGKTMSFVRLWHWMTSASSSSNTKTPVCDIPVGIIIVGRDDGHLAFRHSVNCTRRVAHRVNSVRIFHFKGIYLSKDIEYIYIYIYIRVSGCENITFIDAQWKVSLTFEDSKQTVLYIFFSLRILY